ncbi:MAG: hypothetical protein HY928_08110 [Elusimicrobia bacterium]|nr:hypothetical protein [Elusimicrobiota bacterium]
MEDPSARLVETGSLRVDRARALDKLQRFQLGDPTLGFYFWVRCAVASRATRVDLWPGWTSFKIRFDGEPLTKMDLRDPYAVLFGSESTDRAKHLAYGLLWAFRLGGRGVSLTSGPADGRLRLSAAALAGESLVPVKDGETDTILSAEGMWGSFASRPWAPPRQEAPDMLGLCPASVRIDGKEVVSRSGPPGVVVESRLPEALGGGRIRLRAGGVRRASRSEAVVHLDGVSAGRFDYPSRFVRSEAFLESPLLTLDASQTRAVRDAHLDSLCDAAAGMERELLGRILDTGPGGSPGDLSAAREAGWTLLNDPLKDKADPLLAKLWEKPLYEGRTGAALSLAEVLAEGWFDDRLKGLQAWETVGLKVFLTRMRSGMRK